MGLRKPTDEEVLKNFGMTKQRVLQMGPNMLETLRSQMGLVHDSQPMNPTYGQCGICKSTDIKQHFGGHGDPSTYECLACGSRYDQFYHDKGWQKPLLDAEVWDLMVNAMVALPPDSPTLDQLNQFLTRHRKPAGAACWNCKTWVPNSDHDRPTCKACQIKYNRMDLEKRHG